MLHLKINIGKTHAVTAEVVQTEFRDIVYEWDITNSKERLDRLDLRAAKVTNVISRKKNSSN